MAQLDWSLSKIQRIEAGQNTVSRTDVAALLEAYRDRRPNAYLDPRPDERDELMDLAMRARRHGWWSRYRPILDRKETFISLEAESATMSIWQPSVIPEIVQTPAYALHLLERSLPASDGSHQSRVELLMERQKLIKARVEPIDIELLIDETALRRGPEEILAAQLKTLEERQESGHLRIRVMPASRLHAGLVYGSFTILGFGDDDFYVHGASVGEHDYADAHPLRQVFAEMSQMARAF